MSNIDSVQKVYIAYYGRPADPAGLDYWVGELEKAEGNLDAIIAAFANEAESQDRFGDLEAAEQITALYQQLFGRAPETAGLEFWTDELEANADVPGYLGSIALRILEGAQGDDATVVANKLVVAKSFTDAVRGDETANTGYNGDDAIALARALLDGVDATTDAENLDVSGTVSDIADLVPVPGETFALTTNVDTIEGTANDDTIEGTTATLQATDVIVGGAGNDTFNLTLTAENALAVTVNTVENININMDYFTGTVGANTFNATNVIESTITLSSAKLGFNGIAGVDNAKTNNVVAGSNVTNLTVAGITAGMVDAGAAEVVSVTTAAASNVAKVTVNGDIDLTLATATAAEITVTAASEIDLTPGATTKVTMKGAGDVELTGVPTATEIVNSLTSGTLTAVAAGATDVDKWDVDVISVGAAATLTNVALAPVTLTAENLTVSVAGKSATTGAVVINASADQTSLTVTNAKTAAINLTGDVTVGTLTATNIDTTVNVTGDVTIGTLADTGTGKLVLTGTGDVTITAGDDSSVDASGLTGKLTIEGAGAATVTDIKGSAAVDTVELTAALTTGTLAADLGAGDDVVKLGNGSGAAVIAMDGGAGTDTVVVADGANFSTIANWAVSNFEVLAVQDAAAGAVVAQTATVTGKMAESFSSLAILAPKVGSADDTFALTVDANDAATVNLSGLNVTNTTAITLTITGDDTVAQTIVGTNGDDTIDAGTGTATKGNTLTGGAGKDTFVFAANDSVEASMTKITDFTVADDKLDLPVTVLVADNAIGIDVGTAAGLNAADVKAVVTDGIMTFSGLGANVAEFNTLAEWIDAAELVATDTGVTADVIGFQFNGNTYIVSTDVADATDAVIELTGLTGVTALDTAAAANTIVLA